MLGGGEREETDEVHESEVGTLRLPGACLTSLVKKRQEVAPWAEILSHFCQQQIHHEFAKAVDLCSYPG